MTRTQDALALLVDLAARGVEFMVDGGRILFRPVAVVSQEERALLRDLKSECIMLLRVADPTLEALCSTRPPERMPRICGRSVPRSWSTRQGYPGQRQSAGRVYHHGRQWHEQHAYR